jgi:hypothetical protein
VPITIEKSLPQSATGAALYNDGANWARLIQKAFVVFVGRFGKYGQAFAREEPANPAGYDAIASGLEYRLYGVFYGSNVSAPASRSNTTFSATASDAETLLANQDTITKLLQFKGQGIASNEAVNLTTGATLTEHLKRARDIMPLCIPLLGSGITNLVWFQQELGRAVTEEEDPRKKNWSLDRKTTVKSAVDSAAEALNGDWGPLVDRIRAQPASRELQTLYELLLDLKRAGTDSSTGQRFIYSAHAYAIVDAVFRRDNGQVFVPDIAQLARDLPQVSATRSTVTLRNPHHGNEPNPTGGPEAAAGPEQGKFSLSLAQYLRNFTELDYGRVRKTT